MWWAIGAVVFAAIVLICLLALADLLDMPIGKD